jgi:hypothetical protein
VSKAFREPVVDFSEHGAPFVTAIGVAQQSSEARRGAQLQAFALIFCASTIASRKSASGTSI